MTWDQVKRGSGSSGIRRRSPGSLGWALAPDQLPGPRFQLFVVGSASGVTVTVVGFVVLSTVLTAPFHVPKTASGGIPMPPYCQSPASGFPGFAVTSVMYIAGIHWATRRVDAPA